MVLWKELARLSRWPNPPPLRKIKAFARHILDEVNLDSRETTFLQHCADLVAIAEGGERNWLDRIMKKNLGWRLSKDVLINCCRAFDSKIDQQICRRPLIHPRNPSSMRDLPI